MALLQSGYALPAQGHGAGKTYLSTGGKATYRDRNAVAGNRATSEVARLSASMTPHQGGRVSQSSRALAELRDLLCIALTWK